MASLLKIGGYVPHLFYSQFFSRPAWPTHDFSGQFVIITGSNTGLGLEAARHVARLGAAKVILAVRTVSKGDIAKKDIIATTGAAASNIEIWPLDMGSTDSIKAFSDRVTQLDRLDAAILNAGVMTFEYKTFEGLESHLAINVVGTVLLALQLLPTMRNSAEKTGHTARMTIVGSDLMYVANMSELESEGSILDKINEPAEAKARIGSRYNLSKILVYWPIREIARRSPLGPDSNVIITAMTPGACESELFRDEGNPVLAAVAGAVKGAVARTREVGGRTLVHAVNPNLPADAHGKFLMNEKIGYDGMNVTGAHAQSLAKKWNEELFRTMESRVPGCTGVLENE